MVSLLAVVGILVFAIPPASNSSRPQDSASFTDRFQSSDLNLDAWKPLSGFWSTNGTSAVLESNSEDTFSTNAVNENAVIAVNGVLVHQSAIPSERTSVTLVEGHDGCGVVFRFKDTSNFWYLVKSVEFATWTLRSVENGIDQYRGNSGLSATEDSTRISVIDNSSSIRIVVEGFNLLRSEIVVDTPGTYREGAAGLIGTSNCTSGVWANYVETL